MALALRFLWPSMERISIVAPVEWIYNERWSSGVMRIGMTGVSEKHGGRR